MHSADVLLLSAGFGTRLRPLTETVPKPLIEVGGRTLLDWNLSRIAAAGFPRVFVNVHYLGDKISAYLGQHDWGIDIEVVEEEVILDTGGALKNIVDSCSTDSIIVYNSDILLGDDFELQSLVQTHLEHEDSPISTMALRSDPCAAKYGSLAVSAEDRVVGFLGKQYLPDSIKAELMFLGVSVWSKRIVRYMPKGQSVFSLTKDVIPSVLNAGEWIHSIDYRGYWSDVGTLERLEEARTVLARVKDY
jgi:NDP-sugar pyrophosphorylase family protein